MLGQRVNNFEVVRVLGEGGMGAVYEAKHPLIAKRVAIKVLKPELSVDAEQVQRFFNEARATSAIRHPNIVEVIDLGRLPAGTPYLVMELLEGETLGDRLDRLGALDIPLALDFTRQAAAALEAAHAHGIVHRDLKPDNLFLVPDQRLADRELVKVLDFGIAKLRGELAPGSVNTVAGAVLGTPPYMSPEQCRGLQSAVDERTDIYALGVILYEMLCGRTPFEAEGMGDVMLMHMSQQPQRPSELCRNLPSHIEEAVLRALAKRREDRFSTMAELREALGPSAAPIVALTDSMRSDRHSARALVAGGGFETAASGPQRPISQVARPASTLHMPGVLTPPGSVARPSDAPDEDVVTLRGSAAASVTSGAPVERDRITTQASGPRRRGLWLASAALLSVGAVALRFAASSREQVTNEAPHVVMAAPPQPAPAPAVVAAPIAAVTPPAPSAAVAPAPQPEPAIAAPRHSRPRSSELARKPRRPLDAQAVLTGATPPERAEPSAAVTSTSTTAAATPPAAAAMPPGFLSLDSSPWANVFLGGKLLGTTPLMHVALPPGRHVLTLKNPELDASTSYVVEIKSGDSLSRLVGWEKK